MGEHKANFVNSPRAARTCTVSFTGTDGIRHSVNVHAESLYEAVTLAVREFRAHDCSPGSASELEVDARSPAVTHTVSLGKLRLQLSARSPSDKIMKERLQGIWDRREQRGTGTDSQLGYIRMTANEKVSLVGTAPNGLGWC
jgi:hypothetical protein